MRKALLVGIDKYDSPFKSLNAPESDARVIEELLSEGEDSHYNFSCNLLIGEREKVTESALMMSLEKLFLKGKPEVALFYFAGHGDNKLGGTLVTQNAKSYNLGVSISNILAMAGQSKADNKIIILDCCFAGNVGNMGIFQGDNAFIPPGVTVLASSGADEESLEIGGSGLFSRLLIDALKGAASDVLGNISVANLYAYIDRYLGPWEQRPHFKANISRIPMIRKALPEIEISILKKLPDYFPTPAALYPVTPEYDDELPPVHAEKEAIFKEFRALYRVGLLEPYGADYLYHAARESKACKLTFKGQYYWKLAAAKQLEKT